MCVCVLKLWFVQYISLILFLSLSDFHRFLGPLPDRVPWFPDRASRSQSGARLPWRRVCRCPFRSRIRGRRLPWPCPAVVDAGSEVRTQFLPFKPSKTLSCPSPIQNKSASLSQRTVQDYFIWLHIILLHVFCRSARLWWWWWCSIIFHSCACVCAGYSSVPSSVYDFTILMRVAAEGDTHTVKQTS